MPPNLDLPNFDFNFSLSDCTDTVDTGHLRRHVYVRLGNS